MKRQKGLSFIEWMIGIFLGSCLLIIIGRHYLTTSHYAQASLTRLSDLNERLLISDLLITSIQQAGFTPCASIQNLIMTPAFPPIELIKGDKQGIQVTRMSETFSTVSSPPASNKLTLIEDLALKQDDVILLADCFHAEIQRIQHVSRESQQWHITLKGLLHYTYNQPIYIGKWLTERFYLQNNTQGQPIFYYQIKHPEALSRSIKKIELSLNPIEEHPLIHIKFITNHHNEWSINARARA